VIVDSWLRIHRDEMDWDELKSQFMVYNPEYMDAERMGRVPIGIPKTIPIWEEDGEYILVPRGTATRYIGNPNYGLIDHTSIGLAVDMKPRVTPRENQVSFIDGLYNASLESYGTIGQAQPGFGKTVGLLLVAAMLGRTTLVLVHKSFLLNQWIERIKEFYDIKDSEIGIIQQDKCEYEGKKICIAMAQSVLSRDGRYPEEMYKYFGTLLIDEVHRFSAPTFRQVIVKFPARYRIGVTATVRRTDGLQTVFIAHIGRVAVIGEKRNVKPVINQVAADMIVANERSFKNHYTGRQDLTKIISFIVKSDTFNKQVVRLAIQAIDAGRKLIIFSDRRGHLDTLGEMLKDELQRQGKRYTYGFYVGGMKENELAITATRDIMLATTAMAEEGLDVPELDTCFLTTPKGRVEQIVGRITRDLEGKKTPMVIDFVHPISMCKSMASNRLRQYKKLGWK